MKRRKRSENVLALCTLVTLVIAAIIGYNRSLSDIATHFQTLLPGADRYEKSGFETYKALNKFLMGYWPDVHHQLYWYLMIFGVLLIFLTTNKNIYCHYVCPFGAAQECLAAFGKAKNFHSKRYHELFKWLRRFVVWLAVFIALVFRNPGISSNEVYSTLFSLSGTNREVLFLALVLLFSLFVKRPWCKYLCPVPAFEDYLGLIKNRTKALFRKGVKKPELKSKLKI